MLDELPKLVFPSHIYNGASVTWGCYVPRFCLVEVLDVAKGQEITSCIFTDAVDITRLL